MAEIYDSPSETSLWWMQKPEDAWKNLLSLSESAGDDNTARRGAATYNARILEGLGLTGLGAWGYGKSCARAADIGAGRTPIVWNYAAAGLDTLVAKVVGQKEPKPFLMVTDGDYDDERQAVWNGRLLEGLYREDQGKFLDVWDLGRHAFKVAAGVTGTTAIKVVPYADEGRLIYELHDTLDMFIDYFECTYSNPLTYGEKTWFDPHRLMAAFDSPAQKKMIWDSREQLPESHGGDGQERQRMMVALVEGWRLKIGKEDGRYMAVCKNGILDKSDYPYTTPPFAFLHARRSMAGFYGVPIMERGMPIVAAINQILQSMSKGERLLPKNLLIYDIDATPKELMKNVHDIMQVGFSTSGNPGAHAPQYITPALYDQTVMQLLEAHIRAFHETLGISASQMSAQKDPGIVAAAAIRTVADLFTQLFAVQERDFQKFITTNIGGLTLRGVNDLNKQTGGFSVRWDGGKFMRQVKSQVADMGDKKFTISINPVSETRNTPADRVSMADEMLSRKELSPEGYQRVLATGDLPRETKRQQTQQALIEQSMDSWMYDELDEITNTSPLPWMNTDEAIVQILDGYMSALMNPKFPVDRELHFRRYISQCDTIGKRNALERAKLEAAARGAPMQPTAVPQAAE